MTHSTPTSAERIPTPRTDERTWNDETGVPVVGVEFARTLERELDKWRDDALRAGLDAKHLRAELAALRARPGVDAEPLKCEDCDGTGEQGDLMHMGDFQPPERERCSSCGGSGYSHPPIPAPPNEERVTTTPTSAERIPGEPAGWRHTLDSTEGLPVNRSVITFTHTPDNPFGVPGKDYSETFQWTAEPLYLNPRVAEPSVQKRAAEAVEYCPKCGGTHYSYTSDGFKACGHCKHQWDASTQSPPAAGGDDAVKCADCGALYRELGCDLVLPDDQWALISPDANILCASCICIRANKAGATVLLASMDIARAARSAPAGGDDEREAFEDFMDTEFCDHWQRTRSELQPDCYESFAVQSCWLTWQAARAARSDAGDANKRGWSEGVFWACAELCRAYDQPSMAEQMVRDSGARTELACEQDVAALRAKGVKLPRRAPAKAAPIPAPPTQGANQCDGCNRQLPLNENGNHVDADGLAVMACSADLYAARPAPAQGVGESANRPGVDAEPVARCGLDDIVLNHSGEAYCVVCSRTFDAQWLAELKATHPHAHKRLLRELANKP